MTLPPDITFGANILRHTPAEQISRCRSAIALIRQFTDPFTKFDEWQETYEALAAGPGEAGKLAAAQVRICVVLAICIKTATTGVPGPVRVLVPTAAAGTGAALAALLMLADDPEATCAPLEGATANRVSLALAAFGGALAKDWAGLALPGCEPVPAEDLLKYLSAALALAPTVPAPAGPQPEGTPNEHPS